MHPTKSPDRIYVEKTLKQYCLGCRNSQKIWKGVSSEETIPLDHKAGNVSHGHVNDTLPEEATL